MHGTSASHPFDRATAVEMQADGTATAHTGPEYYGFVGQFGGATAATLLRAVLAHPDLLGEPVAQTVNFAAAVEKGPYRIEARPARTNRSTQHWQVAAFQGDDPMPRITATTVTGIRRAGWSHQSAEPPVLRDPSSLAAHETGGGSGWTSRYRFHFDSGAPEIAAPGFGEAAPAAAAEPAPAASTLWLGDAPDRPIDHLSVAALADAFFARVFHIRRELVPLGTVTMSTWFHAGAAELAGLGATLLAARVDGRRSNDSYSDQSAELWSPDGRLVATSHQLVYYKA
ncbi:acyl-CoA thioesterase [Marinibaculum pumilum]|uniref:Acyl-CoA thioesterase n=1 Tax=Marinibaculum pumilum TaxID=1766165 RepID=A0ABV7KY12_9PROT